MQRLIASICRSRRGRRPARAERFALTRHPRLVSAFAFTGIILGAAAFAETKNALATNPLPNVAVTTLFPNHTTSPPPPPEVKKYENNPVAIAAGKAIFEHYNCSGCHFHGAGGMGPPFINDGHFIYGGRLDQIFASIFQGRPNGMPSWGRIIPAQEIWEIASYVKALSEPSETSVVGTALPMPPPSGGDAQNGARLLSLHGCGSCHAIPGVPDATGTVGPPLGGFAGRAVIAGMLPNTPDNLMAWIENPQAIVPGNAMPNLGLKDNEVRDIATYLYTLH